MGEETGKNRGGHGGVGDPVAWPRSRWPFTLVSLVRSSATAGRPDKGAACQDQEARLQLIREYGQYTADKNVQQTAAGPDDEPTHLGTARTRHEVGSNEAKLGFPWAGDLHRGQYQRPFPAPQEIL